MEKQLFGTYADKDWVFKVEVGDICLLYNTGPHNIQGVWEAVTKGQSNIDPAAWQSKHSGLSEFPNQVRVKQRSEQIQSVPKDLVRGIATGSNNRVLHTLKGESAQKMLKLFSTTIDTEVLYGTPLGQEELDYRLKYPAKFLCSDGHRVRSLSEKSIDEWLANHHIFHSYEPYVFVPDVTDELIPDFGLYDTNNSPVYLEFWGMESDPNYQSRMQRKRSIYAKHRLALIEMRETDLQALDKTMHDKFREFKIDWKK